MSRTAVKHFGSPFFLQHNSFLDYGLLLKVRCQAKTSPPFRL